MSFITPDGDCWQAVCKVCAAAFQKSCPLSEASCYELIAPETSEFTEHSFLWVEFIRHALEVKVPLLAVSRPLACCRTCSRIFFLSSWLSHHLLGTGSFTARHWLVPLVVGHFELAASCCQALLSDAWCPWLVLGSCMPR